jgi:hypothetical protein
METMDYQENLELICEQCGQVFEATDSMRKYDFCSAKCEAQWAELNSEYVLKVRGRFPRIGYLDGEKFTFLNDPGIFIYQVESYHNPGKRRADFSWKYPMDIFTFLQHPSSAGTILQYPMELANLAILPISSFDNWWTKQVDTKTRNMARKAEKKGVEIKEVLFSDDLARGISEIYNETPIRQGRKFPHYGMTFERAKEYAGTFPERSIFVGAYLDGKLIGFLKMVMNKSEDADYACILHILSMVEHRDKSPTNALIAQAVKSCADRKITQLAYDRFSYGKKERDTLVEFKMNNGFMKVDVARYYVPLTIRGEIAFKLGLHRKFSEQIPEFIASPFRKMRAKFLR